jgi:Tripartite tricarboxylate transporter TctB family
MKERIVALGILAFALVYCAASISLKVGTLAEPGAGQFPTFIAVCLLGCSGLLAYRAFRTVTPDTGHVWNQVAPIGIAVSLVAYPVLLRALAFLPSTFIVLAVLFKLLGVKSLVRSTVGAGFTTVVSFVVFGVLLGVVLPSGQLEQSLLRLLGV